MKKLIPLGLGIIVIGGLVVLAFNTYRHAETSSNRLKISASIYPLAEFTRQVGGNVVDVQTITASGVEPHDYEPTPQDVIAIRESKIFFYNGGGVEPWVDKVVPDAQRDGVRTLNMSAQVLGLSSSESGVRAADGGETNDPHFWLSPVIAQEEVKAIEIVMTEVDPSNQDTFRQNSERYILQLMALDQEYRQGLKGCDQKDIVTSHAAFGYLAREYGLRQMSIAGLSPDAEPSSQQLAEISQFAKERNIRYIFFESLASPKLSQTVAREVGAQTLMLNPVEGLSEDERRAGENYLTLMRKNLSHLRQALDCQ